MLKAWQEKLNAYSVLKARDYQEGLDVCRKRASKWILEW
jgi:hypothetical protein